VNTLDVAQLIALASVLGFASGIRLYVVIFALGIAGYSGWIDLPTGLRVLEHPAVLIAAAVMLMVEFGADKIPGIDTGWDMLQTFIRIPAGAAIAAGALGAMDSTTWTVVAAILGGTLAATSHFAKAGTRAAVNTSPEPFSNIAVSVMEDLGVIGLLLLAVVYPLLALAIVVALVLLAAWLLPKLFRFVVRLLRGAPPPSPGYH
jgi:hypothetical protein